MDWFRKYWIKVFLLTCSSILAAIVFMASVLAGEDDYKSRETMLWAGAIAALAVVLVTAADTALNEREKERARQEAGRAARALGVTYNQTLAPISEALGKLAQEYASTFASSGVTVPMPLHAAQVSQSTLVRKTVLIGASVLTAELRQGSGLPTARCSFYRLTNRAQHEFTLEDWAGDPPGARPTIGGAAGSHFLHDILEPRKAYHVGTGTGLVSKVDQFSPKYRSVIAVPVTAGTMEFGVLTVDAPRETDLKIEHVVLMTSLAGFLGATLALAK